MGQVVAFFRQTATVCRQRRCECWVF